MRGERLGKLYLDGGAPVPTNKFQVKLIYPPPPLSHICTLQLFRFSLSPFLSNKYVGGGGGGVVLYINVTYAPKPARGLIRGRVYLIISNKGTVS